VWSGSTRAAAAPRVRLTVHADQRASLDVDGTRETVPRPRSCVTSGRRHVRLHLAAVGATRAASVVWRGGTAAEIDYAAQAAAVESRIIIGVGSDGEILIDDVSVEA
jgi:hypothetical protein